MNSKENTIKGIDCGEQNQQLIEEIFKEYEKLMFVAAFEILQDKQLAEDAVQDSFVALIGYVERIEPGCNVRPLVLTVVRNKAKDLIRRRKNVILAPSINESAEMYAKNDEDTEIFELVEVADKVIALLPESLSTVFIMHYKQEKSYIKIAKELKISYYAVAQRLSRAKKAVREILKEAQKDINS